MDERQSKRASKQEKERGRQRLRNEETSAEVENAKCLYQKYYYYHFAPTWLQKCKKTQNVM